MNGKISDGFIHKISHPQTRTAAHRGADQGAGAGIQIAGIAGSVPQTELLGVTGSVVPKHIGKEIVHDGANGCDHRSGEGHNCDRGSGRRVVARNRDDGTIAVRVIRGQCQVWRGSRWAMSRRGCWWKVLLPWRAHLPLVGGAGIDGAHCEGGSNFRALRHVGGIDTHGGGDTLPDWWSCFGPGGSNPQLIEIGIRARAGNPETARAGVAGVLPARSR